MLSLRTQRQLSGLEENDQIALPPASPSEHELRTPVSITISSSVSRSESQLFGRSVG